MNLKKDVAIAYGDYARGCGSRSESVCYRKKKPPHSLVSIQKLYMTYKKHNKKIRILIENKRNTRCTKLLLFRCCLSKLCCKSRNKCPTEKKKKKIITNIRL